MNSFYRSCISFTVPQEGHSATAVLALPKKTHTISKTGEPIHRGPVPFHIEKKEKENLNLRDLDFNIIL